MTEIKKKPAAAPAAKENKMSNVNPALLALIKQAQSGAKVDVSEQVLKHVDSALPIDKPCIIDCTVKAIRFTDSFTANADGEVKEQLPAWANATPQIVVTFVDSNNPRFHTRFFNLEGFVSYAQIEEQLSEANMRPEDIGVTLGDKGYALVAGADGKLVRIHDETKTADCLEIVSRFFTAVDLDGYSIKDAVETMAAEIEEQEYRELTIKFALGKEYNGKDGEPTRKIEATKFMRKGNSTEDNLEEQDSTDTFEEESAI